MDTSEQISTFLKNVPDALIVGDSYAENLLLREYGAVFVARGGVVPPDRIIFANEEEVSIFQAALDIRRETIGGLKMELQRPAMDALVKAANDARSIGKSITPRGPDSARRGYDQTVELWASRVEPALDHWLNLGRFGTDVAAKIRSLAPSDQVAEVLQLESEGIWFAKDLTKSIIYSVAPPGTSQHLSLLAFDAKEFGDAEVRACLAANGWFRTVISDLPHFTFLGVDETELEGLGLKRVESNGDPFWVPDL